MTSVAIEAVIILALILTNGTFALAEMAIVSVRKARLQQRADEGDAKAKAALDLANDPSDFLSTVQIGITSVGILAGAFGGATIARELARGLALVPILAPYADVISVVVVVVVITFFTLVLGELAPKRLALTRPERIAAMVAPGMRRLSKLVAPLARFLSFCAEAVLRLLGVQESPEPDVTEEEIRIMIERGTQIGVFEPAEEELVERVFRLADRRVSSVMTPRPELVWIDVDDPPQEIVNLIATSGFSRFPVAAGSLDNVLGLVLAKDLLAQSLADQDLDPRAALRPASFVPETMSALDMLDRFREARAKIALVVDEYGTVEGLVTAADILEAIVGDMPELGEPEEVEAFERGDGSWLLDGMLPLDELEDRTGIKPPSELGVGTVGGAVMALMGQIPSVGDRVEWGGVCLEVIEMDARRIDKVLLVRAKTPASAREPEG